MSATADEVGEWIANFWLVQDVHVAVTFSQQKNHYSIVHTTHQDSQIQ